jgi:hypothetical protein
MSKDHHADGQNDSSEGKYNPPHSITPLDAVIQDKHTYDKLLSDNEQYDAGYKNDRKQK